MKVLGILAATVALTACTAPLRPEGVRHLGNQHVLKSNYEVGKPLTVNVGDPMVKVQDYWEDSFEEPSATPNKSFTMTGGPVNLAFLEGQSYQVKGRMAVEGKDYQVVANQSNPIQYQAALLGDDGKLLPRVVATNPGMNGDHVMVIYTLQISPPDGTLIRQPKTRVNTNKGFVNYEILFTGITDSAINLTYREFSPEGLARVAFFQSLTYPRNASTITFRNLKMSIEQVSGDNITFRVLEDRRT